MALKDPSQIKLLKHRNKYGAKKCQMNGIVFSSKAEAAYYVELMVNKQPHVRQYVFKFKCGTKYVADFGFFTLGERVVIDVKGVETPAFRIKKKLMKSEYGIDVQVVKMPRDKVERLLAIGRAMFGEKR